MPMSNLYLQMLENVGVAAVDHFGDSDSHRLEI